MKRFYLLSIICAGIILFSLFLPYEETYYTIAYTSSNNEHIFKSGWKLFPATFIPIVIVGLIVGLNRIRQNLAIAIIGLLLSFSNVVYMGLLAILLTLNLNFFGPSRTSEIEIGYFVALLTVLIHAVIMIVHLIQVFRNRKNPRVKKVVVAEDLLDSGF